MNDTLYNQFINTAADLDELNYSLSILISKYLKTKSDYKLLLNNYHKLKEDYDTLNETNKEVEERVKNLLNRLTVLE